MDLFRNVDGKLLRMGHTTGSCAAGAAAAACEALLGGASPQEVSLPVPYGVTLVLKVEEASSGEGWAACAVRKDAGDDPDVTDGMLIFARVELIPSGIEITGGEGVGTVTRPGLDQKAGQSAINSVPREMISSGLMRTAALHGYAGGFRVTVSAPGGEETAKRTFNPRLGIEGGISILGTSGVVRPMSSQAVADTVRLDLTQKRRAGNDRAVLVFGDMGARFAEERLSLDESLITVCSNRVGDGLDAAAELGFAKVLLVGHAGKMVKLAIGATDTHSSAGDGRIEALIACALAAGASRGLLVPLSGCATTDAALDLLENGGLLGETASILGERILATLRRRLPGSVSAGFVCTRAAGKDQKILVGGGEDCDSFRRSGARRP